MKQLQVHLMGKFAVPSNSKQVSRACLYDSRLQGPEIQLPPIASNYGRHAVYMCSQLKASHLDGILDLQDLLRNHA